MKTLTTLILILISIASNAQLIDDFPKKTNVLKINISDVNIDSVKKIVQKQGLVLDPEKCTSNTLITMFIKPSPSSTFVSKLVISITDNQIIVRSYYRGTESSGLGIDNLTLKKVEKRKLEPYKTMWEGMFRIYAKIYEAYPGSVAWYEETE